MNPAPQIQNQRGVAIITALLIVALATTISAGIATSVQLEVRRTGNMLSNDQALLYIKPAEKLASNVLEDDRKKNNIDHLDEGWAQDIPPIELDGVQIAGKLSDMQACFNLNSLAPVSAGTPPAEGSTATTGVNRLKLLLKQFDISANSTDAVIDWLDTDNSTNTYGAEDGYYLNLEKPYRTGNQKFQSASELRLVRGFEDNKKFNALLPSICAFGSTSSINVNTAPAEVLLSLASSITKSDVDTVIQTREITPFEKLADFFAITDLNTKITDKSGISVDSEYFLLTTYLQAGSIKKTVYSIISRTPKGDTKIIRRSQSVL